MISAFAHIIDVHAQRDAIYTPSNVGLNIDQDFVAPWTSIMQKILENDYVVNYERNEATNANGVCEWFTCPPSRAINTS